MTKSEKKNHSAIHTHPLQLTHPLFEYIRYTEFKRILGYIQTALERNKQKSLAILSELPGEGKTFLVTSLALAYATLLNKKVMVVNTVDGSQSESFLLETFSLSQNKVLEKIDETGFVFYDRIPQSPSNKRDGTIDLVSPLANRDQNPLLASADFQLKAYLQSVQQNYDIILLDTCAINSNNVYHMDPILVASQSDLSLLVQSIYSVEKNTRKNLIKMKTKFDHWKVNLMGTLYNAGAAPRGFPQLASHQILQDRKEDR